MPLKALQENVVRFFKKGPQSTPALPLLEVSCFGNPEKTLQGELLVHLRQCGWMAIQEMGYQQEPGERRNLDIVVLAKDEVPSRPLCIIELKHYSANQGSTAPLTGGMERDFGLDRPNVPLMQVGVYTVVTNVAARSSPYVDGVYRFLNTYCGKQVGTPTKFATELANWKSKGQWNDPVAIGLTPTQSFTDDQGRLVSGYLEFFVGIRKTGDPASFREWALGKWSGCDGGDAGTPEFRSIWLFGIEHGDSDYEGSELDDTDTTNSIERQSAYNYNRNAFKLLAAVHGYSVEEWPTFAEKYQPFVHGSRGFFKGNIYPYPCLTVADWSAEAQVESGFVEKASYLDWCRHHRLAVVRKWADEHLPELIICTGIGHVNEFARAFTGGLSSTFVRHAYAPSKYLHHQVYDGRLVVVIPHLSGSRWSHEHLQEVGEFIAAQRRLLSKQNG